MNYNIDQNWLFSKQFKAATVTLLLAASLLLAVGAPIAPSASAAVTGTLTLSNSASGTLWGNQTLQITVVDSDINVNAMAGTYNQGPTITWSNATGTYYVNSTQNTGGSWVAYATDALWVTYQSGCGVLNATSSDTPTAGNDAAHTHPGHAAAGSGSNGLIIGSCADNYVKVGHLSNGVPSTRTYTNHTYTKSAAARASVAHSIVTSPVIHGFNMTRSATITITYKDTADSTGAAKDVSSTFTYKESKATAYNTVEKQATVTPGGKIDLYVTNYDRNGDPTLAETFSLNNNTHRVRFEIVTSSNATLQNLVNKTMNYFGTAAIDGHKATAFKLNFTETGLNTGIFRCNQCIDMTKLEYNTTGTTASRNIWNFTARGSGDVAQGSASHWNDGDTFKVSFYSMGQIGHSINSTQCKGSTFNSASGVRGACLNQTSVTFTISETVGTLSTSASALSHSDDVTVTITDADVNHNPLAVDTVGLFAEINDSTAIAVTGKETGANTSAFTFTVRATTAATTTGCSFSSTTYRLTCSLRPSQAKNTVIDVTYKDAYASTATLASVAAQSLTFTTTTATLSTNAVTYDENADSITLTWTEPDANDASATIEQMLFNSTKKGNPQTSDGSCSGIYIGSTCNDKKLSNFTITSINGTNGYHDIRNFSKLVQESGKDTGIWTTTVTLSSLRTGLDGAGGHPLGLAAGDSLVFTVKDLFDAATVNVTVTIGGTVGALTFDRTDFPITVGYATNVARNQTRVNATVTLTDSDKNTNVNARDNATLRMIFKNGTGEVVGQTHGPGAGLLDGQSGGISWYNVTALETGVNTGIFTFKWGVNWGDSNTDLPTVINYSKPTQEQSELDRMQDMVGGSICFEWADGASSTNISIANPGVAKNAASKGVAKCLDIKAHDSSITADITTGKLGDSFTVTATSADHNRDVEVKDKLYMVMIGTSKQTAPAETDTAKYNTTVALTETGVNTGEFTKTIKLEPGKSPFGTTLTANQYIRLRIRDNATSNSFYSGAGLARASSTHAITVQSTTATLTVSPGDETGPDNKLYVKLVDPDLMTTAASAVTLTKVISNGTSDEESPTASNGTTATGTYWFGITIARSTGSPTNEDGTLHVNGSDIIYFYYSDTADASGTLQVITASLTVKTVSGTIGTDKANYLVGEFVEITVTDMDANTNPETLQSITVKVTTESWEVGKTITLQETAADSDVFTGKIELLANTKGVPSASQVTANVGDTVTIKYTDTLCNDSKKCTIIGTAKVGQALSKTEQVPASDPEIVDTAGNALAAPTANDILIVQATITNDDDVAHTVTFLVQIKNSAGEIVNLGWVRDIELSVDESQTPGLSWLPDGAGTYTAEVYVWESLSSAVALSPVKTITFTVA